MSQIMAPLPPERITPCHAFARTGLDYAGPFKAVHLELAGDLSTASLLGALTRFSGRRGRPSELWSDNATHFHRADLEIRNALNNERLNWITISDRLAEDGIKWSFSGEVVQGSFEAYSGATASHLRRNVHDLSEHRSSLQQSSPVSSD
ncbi:uncharacterized protein LOC106651158 [Trichogramma pretiosum]|uniref:uncharacterized protein LOC106651158 n=1 Tax=Trichogramma pretiosum TaxID=7493 RepID=UPI0006C9C92D|nr:uncharacterized protein LOC106651158 [Trichogramma pretiosum]